MSNIAHRDLVQKIVERFGPAQTDVLDTLNNNWYSDNGKYRLTCTYSACFLYDLSQNELEGEQPSVHVTNLGKLPFDFSIKQKVKLPTTPSKTTSKKV
jgi:hypothetical protein